MIKSNAAITAKGVLASTGEEFDTWHMLRTQGAKSPELEAKVKHGEGGILLAFYVRPPKRRIEPPHIYKWPPEIWINPAGPDPGPMVPVVRLTGLIGQGLVELADEVESLRQLLSRLTRQSEAHGEKPSGPSKKR